MTTRADVVRVARSFLSTPFHHLGRQPGIGLDCVGVPICISRELGTVAPDFDIPPYTPTPDGHTMMEWCNAHLTAVSQADMQPGDMIILAIERDPQHIGILGDYRHGGLSIIHAASNARPPRVIETRLMFSRSQRFVAAFALAGVA
ncbi:MAG: hypothetical protein U1A72_11660 [Sulfuritalea sp.]|nr:hypothetical protein [Sulfuritalea sp.]